MVSEGGLELRWQRLWLVPCSPFCLVTSAIATPPPAVQLHGIRAVRRGLVDKWWTHLAVYEYTTKGAVNE